jgi:hypothetical protein
MVEVLMDSSAVVELLGFQYVDSNTGTFVLIPDVVALMKLFNYLTKTHGWFKVTALTSQLIAIDLEQ